MKNRSGKWIYTAVTYSACTFLLFLHIWYLSKSGDFWRDEIATSSFCNAENTAQFIELLKHNTIPALFPFLLSTIGYLYPIGDFPLKIIASAIGLFPIIITGTIILKDNARTAAILSILATAFAFSIRWTDSLRGYGLGCATLFCFLFFLNKSRVANTWPDRLVLILFGVMAIMSSYQNWPLVLIGIGLNIFYMMRMRKVGWISFCILPMGACLITIIPQLHLLQDNAEIFKTMRFNSMGLGNIYERFIATVHNVSWVNSTVIILIICVLGISTLSAPSRFYSNLEAILDLVYLVLGLSACFFIINYSKYLPYDWHFVIPLLFASFQISSLWSRLVVSGGGERALIVTLWVVLVLSSSTTLQYLSKKSTNIGMIADFLMKKSSLGDLILVNPWESVISVQHYYRGPASIISIPPISRNDTHRADEIAKFMGCKPDPFFESLTKKIRETLGKGGSVWLVGDLIMPHSGGGVFYVDPAPNTQWGWMSAPYYRMWGEKLGFALLTSASSGSVCTHEVDGSNLFLPYEHEQLYKFYGLKSP